MIKLILLGLLGLYVTFMRKYVSRVNKQKELSISYWFKDNWQELSQSLAFFIAIMIIMVDNSTLVNIDQWFNEKFFPGLFELPAKEILSFLIGWGINEIVYVMNRKKRDWVKENTKP